MRKIRIQYHLMLTRPQYAFYSYTNERYSLCNTFRKLYLGAKCQQILLFRNCISNFFADLIKGVMSNTVYFIIVSNYYI